MIMIILYFVFWLLVDVLLALYCPDVNHLILVLVQCFFAYFAPLPSWAEELVKKRNGFFICSLDREEFIRLVRSSGPPYELISEFEKKGYGKYEGGFAEQWRWNDSNLKALSDKDLIELYKYMIKTKKQRSDNLCCQKKIRK